MTYQIIPPDIEESIIFGEFWLGFILQKYANAFLNNSGKMSLVVDMYNVKFLHPTKAQTIQTYGNIQWTLIYNSNSHLYF